MALLDRCRLDIHLHQSVPLGSALTTDIVPKESVARALSYHAASWLAGIFAFTATGQAFQRFGPIPTFLAGACLPIIALALVAAVRRPVVALDADGRG